MTTTAPFGLAGWLPPVRGGAPPVAALDVGRAGAPAPVASTWADLSDGERLALRGRGRPGRLAPVSGAEEALDGERSVERFVVFSGAEGGAVLVPTTPGRAFRSGLALLPCDGARASLARQLLAAAAPLGAARRLGLPELAVWTKGDARAHGDDALASARSSVAVSLDPAGDRRPVVVRIADERGGATAVVRVGRAPEALAALQAEADALRAVGELAPEVAPRLLDRGERDGRAWIVHEPLDGRRSPAAIGGPHVDLLGRLFDASAGSSPLDELAVYRDARARLASLDPAEDPDWHREETALADALDRAWDGAAVPTAFAHGDLTPWNVLLRRGRAAALRWERALPDAPALLDLVHFHVQAGVLALRHDGARVLDRLGSVAAGPAAGLLARAGIEPADLLRLVGLHLLHVETRDEVERRTAPVLSAEAGRLRRTRREIARRLIGLLAERRVPAWALRAGVRPVDAVEGAPSRRSA